MRWASIVKWLAFSFSKGRNQESHLEVEVFKEVRTSSPVSSDQNRMSMLVEGEFDK